MVDTKYGNVWLPPESRNAMVECLTKRYGWIERGPPRWIEGVVHPGP